MNESHKLPSSNQKFTFIRSCFSWLEEKSFVILPSIAVLLTFSVLSVYFHYFSGELLLEHDKWGQFGDYLGGVLNPIFGFLGFIALLLTLKLQRQELKLSTEELAKSAKALELQNKALAQQNFENTFFQLLRRYSEVVAETNVSHRQGGVILGRIAFKVMYDEYLVPIYRKNSIHDEKEKTIDTCKKFFAANHHILAHYYRNLYHILKFIDGSQLNDEKKSEYANIARAQISSFELCLIFYNGFWGEGKIGLKPLIEKYGILKHLDFDLLFNPDQEKNKSFYEPTAFLGISGRAVFKQDIKNENDQLQT